MLTSSWVTSHSARHASASCSGAHVVHSMGPRNATHLLALDCGKVVVNPAQQAPQRWHQKQQSHQRRAGTRICVGQAEGAAVRDMRNSTQLLRGSASCVSPGILLGCCLGYHGVPLGATWGAALALPNRHGKSPSLRGLLRAHHICFCLHSLLQGHKCLGTLPTVQHTTVLDCQMPMLVLQRDRHCNVQGPWRVQIAIASVSPVLSKTALRDSRSLAAEVLTPAGSAAAAASPPSLGSEASFWAAPSAWKSTLMAPHATRLSQLRSGRWPPWAHAPPRAPVSCIDPPKKSLTQRRCSPPLSTSCAQIASRCPPPAPPLRSP